jgi:hypothetical protein
MAATTPSTPKTPATAVSTPLSAAATGNTPLSASAAARSTFFFGPDFNPEVGRRISTVLYRNVKNNLVPFPALFLNYFFYFYSIVFYKIHPD